jgi:predicted RNA binding protein YcfA (HicA-like mRNA interferase family)
VPRLKCTYAQFLDIILAHGFVLHHQGTGSHRRYRGIIDNVVRYVDWCPHNVNDVIPTGTLASMIRQSGLPKALFRK